MHFEENQLSRGLISLSLRPTAHPALLKVRGFGPPQRFTVASTWPWVGHLRFGSSACDYGRPIRTRFRYAYAPKALKLATDTNS